MDNLITGLHHVTALASDAQSNIDFYTGVLGLRMVKRTINFDAPDVYHLYYGNRSGDPGTVMTFFPYPDLTRGRKGKGQVTTTSFSVSENSLDYWTKRLDKFNIPFKDPQERFDEAFIYLEDNEGLGIELVVNSNDQRPGFTYGTIPLEHSIKGFYSVTLCLEGYERTAAMLTHYLDHELVAEKGNRFRFSSYQVPTVGGVVKEPARARAGAIVDIQCTPDTMRGRAGSGTIHHVAFATADDDTQVAVRKRLQEGGFDVTPVIDRQYFHSIYFREPGGVLFEVATSDMGFTIDEPVERLGESLKLPAWVEPKRVEIEKQLTPVKLHIDKFMD